MIDQVNELLEDGLKSLPKTLRYTENKWICQKNQNKLHFLHLIDILLIHPFCSPSIISLLKFSNI